MWLIKFIIGLFIGGCLLGLTLTTLAIPYYLYEKVNIERDNSDNNNLLIYGDN